MRSLCVFVLFAVIGLSLQKSTPADDHYVAAVVEYIVNRNVEINKANYQALIKEAAEKNADVVVFPELTLTNSSTSFAVPIHGLLQQYPIPALRPDLYDALLVSMSEAARQNAIYVVINTRESLDCTQPQQGEECPEEKLYVFNTNVVFDRTGAVIDRYRKINLFGEAAHTPALKPDLGVFTTDFGVTFGHFICFDLMFQIPAIQVVQKHNIKDVIFTTMWFSEMPYLTAVQIQESYAYTMDINFVASGANNVRVGSAGSGIYSGKAGALVSIMPGLPTTKLLIAKVPKVPGQVTETYPGPIYDKPSDHDSLRLIQDPSLPAHITRPIVQGSQEFTIVDKEVSCTFRVKLNQGSNTSVQYRAFVQDGTHTYARRELGVAACLLVACASDDPKSCPHRFNQTEETVIEELEIEMSTHRKQFNTTLGCDDIKYFPLSFRCNKYPLSPKNYTYTAKLDDEPELLNCQSYKKNLVSVFQNEVLNENAKETLKYKISKPQSELVAFGIWGRLFNRDIDHNKGISEEDIENFQTILDRIYAADKYQYRAAAFSGVRSFSGVATGGTRNCAVIACTGDTKETCGLRFDKYEENSTAIFEELTIIGSFPAPVTVPALEADDSAVFPISMLVSIMPLEPKDYSYNKTTAGNVVVHTLSLIDTSAELYSFGLWGRVFATDGQDAHPPVEDSSTVQMLCRSLFTCILALFAYNQF